MPSNNRVNIQVGFNVDQSSINAVKKSLQDLQNIRPKDFSGTKNDLNQIRQMAGKIQTALDRAFNVNLGSLNTQKFNAELSTANLSVDKIYQTFSKAGAQGQVAFSKMASSVLTTNMQLKQTRGLISQMGQTMMNTVKWGIASSVMNTFTNSVQQAFQYVKSLDSALTDIRIVTGDSTQQMARFADQANRAASQLGRSTMDYSKAALSFYQQGLDDEAVQARTESVLKAQNITGAGDQMADYLTAVWNGYKVANEQAELYVDKLAAVADSSASKMNQLAVAMSKVASTANTMGVGVDSLNAQIATIVATTRQAPQSVGNALKTIYTRINDIATGSDDAQISLGNYSKKMAEVGISVLDTNGRLRDTQDVIEQVGQKWAGMSKEQQIYLARTMAGQRQINNLTALFDNWGKYIDLVDVSMNSQGATMQKNSRYMESLEAHINQLGAANQRLKTAMIDSNSFKGLIDLGTGAVTVLSNFIQSIGGGGNALLAFGSIATQVFSGTIAKQINNVVTHFQTLKNNAELVKQDIANIKLFGTSEGYQDSTIKAMVDAKAAAAQYYSFMDAAQKNQYNEIVKRIGVTQDQVTLLNEKIKKANDFQNALKGQLDTTIEVKDQLQYMLRAISSRQGGLQLLGAQDQQGSLIYLEQLKVRVNQLRSTVNESAIPGFEAFDEAISKIGTDSEVTVPQLAAVRKALQQIVSQTNTGIDLSLGVQELEAEARQAQANLDMAKQAAQQYLNTIKQFANIQGIVNTTAALGRLASAFNSLSNIKNIWSNQTLSSSQKLLQTITNLGMALPMLATSFGQITKATAAWSAALSLGNKIQATNQALVKAQLLSKARSVTVQKLEAAVIAAKTATWESEAEQIATITGLESQLVIAREAQTVAAQKEAAAAMAANKAILLNPIGLALAATVVTIYAAVKAWDYFTMSAKQAEQALDAFNQKQEQLNNNIQKYNIDKSNLKVDEWEELSRRAGAYNSTINNLTEQQKTRYYELSNLIAEYNQSAVAGYDEQGNAIIETNHSLEETIQLLKQKKQAQIDSVYNSDQYKQGVRAQQVQYKNAIKNQQNLSSPPQTNQIRFKNQLLDLSQQLAISDEIKNRNSELVNYIQEIIDTQSYTGEKFYLHRQEFLSLLQKSSEDVSDGLERNLQQYINSLEDWKKKSEQANKQLEIKSNIDLSKVLFALSTENYNEDYNKAKQSGAMAIDGLIQSFVQGLIEGGQISRDKIGDLQVTQNTDIYTEIVDRYVTDFVSKINEILYTANSQKYGFDQQYNPLNLQQYILDAGNKLEDLNFSSLQQKQAVAIQKIKNIISEDEDLQEALKEDSPIKDALLEFISNAFNLDGLEIDPSFENIKISNNSVDKLKHRIEQLYNEGKSDDLKIKFNIGEVEALLPDDITSGEIDALIPIFEQLYEATGDWEYSLRKAQQQLNFDSAVESVSLLEAKLSGQNLNDQQLQALQSGLNEIKQLYPQIANSVDILNKQWLEGTIVYRRALQDVKLALFNSFSSVGDYTEDVKQQIASLITTTEDLEHALRTNEDLLKTADGPAWYAEQLEKIASNYESCTDQLNRYLLARQSGNLIDQQAAEFDLILATRAEENSQLYGIQAERISEVSKQFLEYAQAGREGYQGLQNNAELTTDMATRYLRLNDAVADIIDNFDKYKEVLQEASEYGTESVRANEQMSDTFANLKEDVAGLLDTSTELFGDDWVVQNMDNILEAAQGNEEALRSLQEAAGQQILINIGVDLSPLGLANEDILNWINQLPDGQIDMTLDDSQFLNQLVWAMQAAGQSQAEIESALKGLSLEVDLTPYQAGLNAAVDAAYQASDAIVSNLGFDSQAKSETQTDQDNAEIAGYLATPQPMTAPVMIPRVAQQVTPFGVLPFFSGYETGTIHFSGVRVEPQLESMDTSKTTTTTALMVKNARKKSGGNIAHSNKKVPGSGGGGRKGGGKKGGGKKAAAPKPGTQAKAINNKIETKEKQKQYNPYQQVEKSYQRQQKAIKNLQQAEKKITGKQRLKNLNAQIDALKKQNKIIKERQEISDDAASEGTTADLRKDILKDKVLGAGKDLFDEDGQLHDQTSMKNAAVDYFNDRIKVYETEYRNVEAQQEKWINDVWNKYNKDQQEKHKNQKEQSDQRVKDAKELYDKQVKQEEEAYKKRIQLMSNYQKKRKQDVKYQQQYFDNLRTIFDKNLQGMTLKAKIDLDAGDALRTWNQFDNRVLRQIDKNDILGNSKAKARKIKTYLDSEQIKDALNTANNLRKRLSNVQNGGYDIAFGINRQDWKRLTDDQKALYTSEAKEKIRAQLEDLIKNTEDGLLKVQDLLDGLQEDYVDSLKQAGDRMDDLIDQYERVNSLLDHQIKVNQLLYGDQAYKYLNKFYEKQRQNNQKELINLRAKQNYWQQQLNAHQDANGNIINEKAWKEAKSNLDKITDGMNSKLQQMMQNAAKTFENKMLKTVDDVNNRLTNGLGTKYVDEQWDQIGQFDDYFLDAVNSKFGIQEVTRAYQQAAATVNDPKQQQKINKLMNDQLKILKEKDKLTEYDIERAKASLQVEKARIALEDARNNKTKMRLRRDSQGNYTYQYIADEQKLTDLQAALDDAQNNLYNQDKQHYKQNLNQLYNTYKDYIEKMTALQKEYKQTQDVQQKKRIQDRMDLLKQSAEIMMSGLTEDNKVTLGTYLRQSLFDAMDWNLEDYTDEQSLALTRQVVPWGKSEIQDLSDNIVGEGGLLNATRDFLSGLAQASQEYDAEIKSAMDTFTGVQSQDMQQAINNTNKSLDQQNQKAGALITTYQGLTEAAKESVKQVASLVEGMQQLLNSSDGFNLGQMGQSLKKLTNVNLNQMGSSARVSTPTIQQQNAKYNTVTNFNDDKNYKGDNQLYQAWINSNTDDLNKFKGQFEIQKQKQQRKEAQRKAAEEAERRAREIEEIATRAMEEYIQNQVNEEKIKNINSLARLGNTSENYAIKSGKATEGSDETISSIANTYNINANFPNATSGNEVAQAMLNLPNVAAQKANSIGL